MSSSNSLSILIAPDKFKGCLRSSDVASAISTGISSKANSLNISIQPLADGGDGFLDPFVGRGLEQRTFEVSDAHGVLKPAPLLWSSNDRTAIIELAEICGIGSLPKEKHLPMVTTSFGVGEMIKHALELGAQRILIGLGGSACHDAGAGMLNALGYEFLDSNNQPIQRGGGALCNIAHFNRRNDAPNLSHVALIACVDVQTILYGDSGITKLFAHKKGASLEEVVIIDEGFQKFARLLGDSSARTPGAGAAGGVAFGLLAGLGATIEKGFDIVANEVDLIEQIKKADLIITAEGALDRQTLEGKAPIRVLEIGKAFSKPVLCVCGISELTNDQSGFDLIIETSRSHDLSYAMANASDLIMQSVATNLQFKELLEQTLANKVISRSREQGLRP